MRQEKMNEDARGVAVLSGHHRDDQYEGHLSLLAAMDRARADIRFDFAQRAASQHDCHCRQGADSERSGSFEAIVENSFA